MRVLKSLALATASAAFASNANAAVLVTNSLAQNIVLESEEQAPVHYLSALEEHLSSVPEGFDVNLDERRLVRFADDIEPVWMTEREKFVAKAEGYKFFDITDAPVEQGPFTSLTEEVYGVYDVSKNVKDVIKKLSTEGPKANLGKFVNFHSRYYRSETGRQSQLWLLAKIKEITSEEASPELQERISITEFEHSWVQRSIIAKIKGSSKSANGSVILSAHQDSINSFPFLPAPGADDDGSGTMTILEAYRGLVASNFTPIHDVEFHWYSAEEGGLLGSQAVSNDYLSRNIAVKALLHYDMTAWLQKGSKETVALMTDNTNAKLTNFLKTLVDKYLDIPWVESTCGYACSDHASWDKLGYPAAIGSEAAFELTNHNIHSLNDNLNHEEFSFDHMLQFSKLAVAFAVEVAGWSK